ncbi:MAG: CAP domain-containing protein [Acidobacteria bacterium]|nr:CAP domain-containing protein [Acidobacteriota bacterium]
MIALALGALLAQSPPPEASLEAAVAELVNEYRESAGFARLRLEEEISAIARERSRRMAAGLTPLGHNGFSLRAQAARLAIGPISRISENTARNRGYANPAQRAFDGWLISPTHRKNLDGDFLVTGVGMARSTQGEFFLTQIFVAPRLKATRPPAPPRAHPASAPPPRP